MCRFSLVAHNIYEYHLYFIEKQPSVTTMNGFVFVWLNSIIVKKFQANVYRYTFTHVYG